jgi:hypothetical protein
VISSCATAKKVTSRHNSILLTIIHAWMRDGCDAEGHASTSYRM